MISLPESIQTWFQGAVKKFATEQEHALDSQGDVFEQLMSHLSATCFLFSIGIEQNAARHSRTRLCQNDDDKLYPLEMNLLQLKRNQLIIL